MSFFLLVVAAVVSIMIVHKLNISNWWMLVIVPIVMVACSIGLWLIAALLPLVTLVVIVGAVYCGFLWFSKSR